MYLVDNKGRQPLEVDEVRELNKVNSIYILTLCKQEVNQLRAVSQWTGRWNNN